MKQKLYEKLRPFYAELLKMCPQDIRKENCPFCVQWGEEFPEDNNKGFLFVGRATNGWTTKGDQSIEALFDGSDKDGRGFARKDQMAWLAYNNSDKSDYNYCRSAFWRVIENVAQSFTATDWYNHVAWSNLYKIAPCKEGNPSDSLCRLQYELCLKIFKEEVKCLSPRFVILLTGKQWEKGFLRYLNDNKETHCIEKVLWGKSHEYEVKVYLINDVYYLLTEHPQGKDEKTHIQALKGIIGKYA